MRLTSPALAARYAAGLRDEGTDVVDVGQVGTEQLYFLVGSQELDGGLMCTASHNPKRYTGAKLVRRGALPLSGDAGIGELRDIVTGGDPGDPVDTGGYESDNVADGFEEKMKSIIDTSAIRRMKVVLDGGNGMAGPMGRPILDGLPVETVAGYV